MSTQVGIFRSNITPIDRLIETTVGREHMLDDLLGKLKSTAGKKGGQHYLFIGPRGIGKTHFLTLIENAVKNEERFRTLYTLIRFPEENNRILSFADFLLGVIEILADVLDDEIWSKLHQSLSLNENDDEIIDTLEPRLKHYRRQSGKTLLILIENIDVLFTEQIKREQDIHRFRSFLMDSPCATLIGTSPVYFPALNNTKSPLYDFFDIQVLEDLSEEQTIFMIRKNLEWEKRDEILKNFDALIPRIQALHIMTGGNPRLIIMLYELISHDNLTDVKLQFQKLLDQISPFYQDRLKELAPQERALLETMALMRTEPRTPAAIAAKLRKSQPQTSALLKRMTQAGYITVSENPADKRSRLYRIKEGFFDLWLAMSESRAQKKKLAYLVDFFVVYYQDQKARESKRHELWKKLRGEEKLDTAQKENCTELLSYLAEVGNPEERCQTKLELAVHNLKEGDAAGAKEILKEAGAILPQRPAFIWITQEAERWAGGEAELDVRKWLDDMIEYWRLQRSGDLEKAVEIALRLSLDISGRGLHAIRIELLQDSLKYISDSKAKSVVYFEIAKSQFMDGQLEKSFNSLQTVLKLSREIGDRSGEGTALNNTSQIYHAIGDYKKALEYGEQSLDLRREIGDRSGEGSALNNISQIYLALRDYNKALEYVEQSLTIWREMGDRRGEGITLNNISQIYDAQGDYKKALEYVEQSLAICREIGDRSIEGTTLNNISQIYDAFGDYKKALEYGEQSLDLRREIGDRSGEGSALNNISQIYLALRDYNKALEYVEQSLTIWREMGDRRGEGITLNNISQIYDAQGDYKKALEYVEQSLAICREIGDRSGLAVTLYNIAHIALKNKDRKKTFEHASEAYNVAFDIGDAQKLYKYGKFLAELFYNKGEIDEAIKILERSCQVGRQAGFPDIDKCEELLEKYKQKLSAVEQKK